ncbi:sensor histidine kinase [Nocardia takedensis]|uniref:sensor histidine kinase n=1 Tax=Nocardia takedensis TaxID=259390 RepID=UPI001FDFC95F|nr:nitrate- and nitrite sensing domain-containing protein [Nocardia takedensis]
MVGVGTSGYLVARGNHAEDWASAMQGLIEPSTQMVRTLQVERQLTLARYAGDDTVGPALQRARAGVDSALVAITAASQPLLELGWLELDSEFDVDVDIPGEMAKARGAIDAGAVDALTAYGIFNRITDIAISGGRMTERSAPDAETAVQLGDARMLLYASEALSRSNAIGVAMASANTPFTVPPQEFGHQVGFWHTQIANLVGDTEFAQRERLETLMGSTAWQQVSMVEPMVIVRAVDLARGATSPLPLPIPENDWQLAVTAINDTVLDAYVVQNRNAHSRAQEIGATDAANSAWAGAGVLVVSLSAIALAVLMANRVIRRLKRLRGQTLALADERLPDMMRRLQAGEIVDPAEESPELDYGSDEIGEVALAFQHAHTAAVEGAVREARTREGVKAVFLNIAHRSQIVVHRQLEILDEAESTQEDPALLETLFRLDHLATRERRNAENLIILGGGRPGRQWRYPVPLVDLVRSAVGETLDYARVRVGRVPEAYIVGTVVADVVHLLAELVDNATSFSPPQSRVEIAGTVVGKGVVIEITDQGMGMSADELARTNQILHNPPDFGVATLSEDSRLGLFVVAQLCVRNGVAVRLAESDYGGVRAIVLLPTSLLADDISAAVRAEAAGLTRRVHRRPEAVTAEESEPVHEPASTVLTAEIPRAPARLPTPAEITGSLPVVREAEPQRTGPDGRPLLPKRTRQANLAPELAREPATGGGAFGAGAIAGAAAVSNGNGVAATAERERSAEQARDLMSAIENGTRQGRRWQPTDEQEQEGDGDRSQNR